MIFKEKHNFVDYIRIFGVSACGLLGWAMPSYAIHYGVYDARGLAMGGTTIAAAKTHQAQYYNPALLAFHEGDEDESKDGRFIFPAFVVQASENLESTTTAVEDELDTKLSNAINAFNANPGAQTAGVAANYARDLEEVLREFVEEDLDVEFFTGMAISEPSDWEGGAFYTGFRVIAIGASNILEEDLELLSAYVEGMEILANGGTVTDLPSEILNVNGGLVDPTTQFNSSADISALGMVEWGVSASKSFELFGQQLSVGLTPKVLRVIAYRETTQFDAVSLNYQENKRTFTALNMDVGFAALLGDHFRVGLAVKDLVPENYETGSGLELQLRPRSRFGVAWVTNRFTVGFDYDVGEHHPVAGEKPTQDASLGFELTPFRGFDIQLGYKHDATGVRDDVIAGGISYKFKKLVTEISYSQSSSMQGAAIQFGWAF